MVGERAARKVESEEVVERAARKVEGGVVGKWWTGREEGGDWRSGGRVQSG